MENLNSMLVSDGEIESVNRRIQRRAAHMSPDPSRVECARSKVEGGYWSPVGVLKGKVYEYFNSRPDLRTPIEISKDEHRELCMRQRVGLVREDLVSALHPFS
ncbi:hypothetical protein QQ045_007183 [Rhodiola kirilowii]